MKFLLLAALIMFSQLSLAAGHREGRTPGRPRRFQPLRRNAKSARQPFEFTAWESAGIISSTALTMTDFIWRHPCLTAG